MKKVFSVIDGVADLTGFDVKDEFIVEAMNHDKRFVTAGKIIANRNLLGDSDLETIWDLANWGCSQPREITVKGGIYDNDKAFVSSDLDFLYICQKRDVDVVNDNVVIRKHYDINNGYYLRSDRKLNYDEWRYGTRDEILADMRANPFI